MVSPIHPTTGLATSQPHNRAVVFSEQPDRTTRAEYVPQTLPPSAKTHEPNRESPRTLRHQKRPERPGPAPGPTGPQTSAGDTAGLASVPKNYQELEPHDKQHPQDQPSYAGRNKSVLRVWS